MSDGSPPASERFPNLYALLGLGPLEPDRARIQQSLKRLASQIQALSQSTAEDAPTPAQLDRARRLFELGKQHLLDPAAKARYDQQWQVIYGSAPATPRTEKRTVDKQAIEKQPGQSLEKQQSADVDRPAVAHTPAAEMRTSAQTWDMSEMQTLLPEGDPNAPFRPEEYLTDRAPQVSAGYAEDFDKLLNLLAPQPPNDHRGEAEVNAAATDSASKRLASENPAALSSPSDQSAVHPAMLPEPTTTATPLAQRLRKKQGPALLWRAIGVLAAVGIVLGVAYWRLQPAKDQPASDAALAAKPDQNSPPTLLPTADDLLSAARPLAPATLDQPAAANEPAPRRSGLPSVPGIDAILPAREASTERTPTSPDASVAPAVSAMPEGAMQSNAMSDMPAPDTAASSETISLSDDERQQWTEGMVAVRSAIGQQQFTQASTQLDSLRPLARTALQRQQLKRWVTIEQLAQRFRQALDRALAGMGAAESFTFGNSNLASFVEADAERIILRIEGRNQTFAMPELPVEIALAIVDMAMDRAHPQSLAAKAAFLLVHPAAQGDQRALNQAQQMMSAAVADQAVPQDMQQAWQDDFELP